MKEFKISIKSVIFFIIYVLSNFTLYIYFFNMIFLKKFPNIYKSLKQNTQINILGPFALTGKKMNYRGQIIDILESTFVKQTKATVIFYLILINIIIFILYILLKSKRRTVNSHGSAKWGGIEEIDFKPGKDKYFGVTLKSDKGVVLGRFNGITLRDNNNTHICVTAPTRTGKGVSIIIPTLIDSWNESVVVLDIKGENYQLTSGARKEKFDNLILRFAPKSKNSCGYNPLAEVRFLTEYEMSDVRLIVDIIMQEDSGSGNKDPYWNNSAADLLIGIIFYVMYKKFLMEPKFVTENGVEKPVSTASMADVVDFITDPTYDVPIKEILLRKAQEENMIEEFGKNEKIKKYVSEKLLKMYATDAEIINEGRHPKAARYLVEKGNLPEQTLGSIIGSAKVKLSIFEIPIVKRNTDHSDFRIFDLMNYKNPVSLYLVVPPADIISLSPLIKILLLQMVNILTPEIDYINKKGHKWKMLMLLDEFPAIGKLEILEKGIGYVAGYGMKMMLILQSLDQLFKIYGKENGFLSNCQAQVFYTSNDETTANYVSKLLGKETIEQFTQSNKTVGTIIKSESQQFLGKDLLSPDEVGRFPSDKIIIKLSGRNPIKSDKIVYFLEKEYSELTKIPYIYTESCYDTGKQYIKLTKEQKRKNSDYPYSYLPYEVALKNMKGDLREIYNSIKAVTPEMLKELDKKELEAYKRSKENYIKNSKGLKKYFELYSKLQKEDPRFKNKESENKNRKSVTEEWNKSENEIKISDDVNYDEMTNLIFTNVKDSSDVVSNISFGNSFNDKINKK
ncbi:conjugal transfer protein TraG [Leptotrichia sp. OH3620_COT-345]|nr:conjugal transfer protein TraG [Leptotrichia sp. OH3620_COT-345]